MAPVRQINKQQQHMLVVSCEAMQLMVKFSAFDSGSSGLSQFQALGQWKRSKKQAPSPIFLPDLARHPPAFSIVHTDREPGTG